MGKIWRQTERITWECSLVGRNINARTLLMAFFKNNNTLVLSDVSRERLLEVKCPEAEKIRSDGTIVAEIHRYFYTKKRYYIKPQKVPIFATSSKSFWDIVRNF